MTPDELYQKPLSGNILLIGNPGTGKSHISRKLKEMLPDHHLIHTDNYMATDYEQGLYDLMDDLNNYQGPTIIEGVQGFRLLRKGVQRNNYYPDVVIHVRSSDRAVQRTYERERDPLKFKYLKGMNKANEKILNDYRNMNNPNPPIWIELENYY